MTHNYDLFKECIQNASFSALDIILSLLNFIENIQRPTAIKLKEFKLLRRTLGVENDACYIL